MTRDSFVRIAHELPAYARHHSEMDPLAAYAYWLPKKLQVLDQSLGKIENGAFSDSRLSPFFRRSVKTNALLSSQRRTTSAFAAPSTRTRRQCCRHSQGGWPREEVSDEEARRSRRALETLDSLASRSRSPVRARDSVSRREEMASNNNVHLQAGPAKGV